VEKRGRELENKIEGGLAKNIAFYFVPKPVLVMKSSQKNISS
jgi:hypothetical protein